MVSSIVIEHPKTVAEQVADHLRDLIATKRLAHNTKLPSYRDFASELGVHVQTVMRGMDLLVDQGVVRRQRAQGCFVNRELSRQGRLLKTLGIVHQASHSHLFTAPFLQQIMQGIGTGPARFDMNIFTMREDGFVTAAQLAYRHVDGVILLGVENHDFLRQCAEWDLPCVVADTCADGIDLDFVACDNAACAQAAVAHVVAKGHRHILYFGADPRQRVLIGGSPGRPMEIVQTDSIERRAAAAREAARHPGVRFDEFSGLLRDGIAEWRRQSDRPTVLMVDSDLSAGDLIQELAKHGISVPSDVSVCAVAGCGTAMAEGGRIAQGLCDFRGMGRKAVELLRWRCEHPAEALPPAVYRVGFEWEEGGSTREARA